MDLERWDEASAAFRSALEIDGDSPDALFDLGWIMLLHGNFGEGWPVYEARRRLKGTIWTKLDGPEWRGGNPSRKIFAALCQQAMAIRCTIRALRRVAKGQGVKVVLAYRLQSPRCFAPWTTISVGRHGDDVSPYDFHAPIMSVPSFWRSGREIPPDIPYLVGGPGTGRR